MIMTRKKYVEIDVAQLDVGLYITLDLSWTEHPFITSSFKIKDQEQLDIIRRLGLKKIRFCPAISSSKPLELTAEKPAAAPVAKEINPMEEAVMTAKKARIERLLHHKDSVVKCEEQLLEAAGVLKKIDQELYSRSEECVAAAGELINKMVDSLLTDKDVAIHAMNDKIGSEEVYHHSLNVAILSMILAKELELPKEVIRLIGLGGIFHDIGKSKIPSKILRKKDDALTESEEKFLKLHTVYGQQIAEKDLKLPKPVVDIILHHHERLDGSGYPDGLKKPAIHLVTQIVAIVNAFDNLCNHIDPSKSLTPYEAISTVFTKCRTFYDAKPLGVFVKCMGVYPPGTIVKLSDDHWGIVVSVNTKSPLKPNVLIYDPEVPKQEAIIIDFNEEPDLSITKTYHPTQLPEEVFGYLSPRSRLTFHFDEAPDSGTRQ